MPQTACAPAFLRVYNAQLGSWDTEMPDTLGSPLTLEARSHILIQDGTLAYIEQRYGLGSFLSSPLRSPEKGILHCWISLPAYTVMSKLGLCLNTEIPGRPEVVFIGSPLVIMLSATLMNLCIGLEEVEMLPLVDNGLLTLEVGIGHPVDVMTIENAHNERDEVLKSNIKDNIHDYRT